MATKDGCAAEMAASGDHPCGVERVDAALLASQTVTTCRAQRGRSCEQGAKMGVVSHAMAHPHEILPRDLGNSAIAVATVSFFTREKVVLLRKERNQLPAPLWLKSFERRSPQ